MAGAMMDATYIYIAMGAGISGVLGVLCFLVSRWQAKLRQALPKAASRTHPQCEPFFLLKTGVRQLSPGFYVVQLVFSNKKSLPIDDHHSEPSRHFLEDKN